MLARGQVQPVLDFGRLLLAQNQLNDAIICLHQAVGLQSSYIEARFTLGVALARTFNEFTKPFEIATVIDYLKEGVEILVYRAGRKEDSSGQVMLSKEMLRTTNPLVMDGLYHLPDLLFRAEDYTGCEAACMDIIPLMINTIRFIKVKTSPTFKHAELILFQLHLACARSIAAQGRGNEAVVNHKMITSLPFSKWRQTSWFGLCFASQHPQVLGTKQISNPE